ncbi:MAG: type II secretion system GspH family protein [Nitrospirae bacterium]|nr:type II secretion system GspH family protein [Nitrospirota bacterium]
MNRRRRTGACSFVFNSSEGFTLLEILVSIMILGIAITVVLQLFSANLRSLASSEDYVFASAKALSKIREVLDEPDVSTRTWSENTQDGYKITVSIIPSMKERTENIPIELLLIDVFVGWTKGASEKSINLKTYKVVKKKA